MESGDDFGTEADLSGDISTFLNLTLDADILSSTPGKRNAATPVRGRTDTFKKPATSKSRHLGPVLATCKHCGAEYRTLRYFNRHMQAHKLKDLASRVPDIDKIKEMCEGICAKVIEIMISKPSVYGASGDKFRELLNELKGKLDSEEWKDITVHLCDQFCVVLSAEKYTMPSALLLSTLQVADAILSSLSRREFILSRLGKLTSGDDSACDSFICEFVLTFADQLVVFLYRSLRKADEMSRANERDIVFSSEQRQAIFYVGGAVIHGIRIYGKRYSKNKKWQDIVDVIDSKIMEDANWDTLSDQQKEDRKWTEQRNRGGLIFLKERIQSFFLAVAKIILKSQRSDGSLPMEEILEKVVVSQPKLEWDNAVGNSLHEDVSLTLMIGVVKRLTATYGKGIIKRIMNLSADNSATVSLPLRHKVAPH